LKRLPVQLNDAAELHHRPDDASSIDDSREAGGSSKRRRFSLEEVEEGLCAKGLDQPILSMLKSSSAQKRPASLNGVGDEAAPLLMKRRRRAAAPAMLLQGMPGATCDAAASPLSWAITPYRSPGSFGRTLRRPARSLAVDPLGIVFIISDPGFFWAEMPVGTRPQIKLADDSIAEIAKVAITFDGTAYLLSEKDQLLTVVPASACLEDCKKTVLNRGRAWSCLGEEAGEDAGLQGLQLFGSSQGDAHMGTEPQRAVLEPELAEDVSMIVD